MAMSITDIFNVQKSYLQNQKKSGAYHSIVEPVSINAKADSYISYFDFLKYFLRMVKFERTNFSLENVYKYKHSHHYPETLYLFEIKDLKYENTISFGCYIQGEKLFGNKRTVSLTRNSLEMVFSDETFSSTNNEHSGKSLRRVRAAVRKLVSKSFRNIADTFDDRTFKITLATYSKRDEYFSTFSAGLQLPEHINVCLDYGADLDAKHKKILSFLKEDKNGFCVFNGPPGTGKSTYIKYLIKETYEQCHYYFMSGLYEEVGFSEFISFLQEHAMEQESNKKNMILVLEDSEKIISKRSDDGSRGDGLSTILNIGDGIISDAFPGVKMILTFNTKRENVDSAILRSGRTKVEHEFKGLSMLEAEAFMERQNPDGYGLPPDTVKSILKKCGIPFQGNGPERFSIASIIFELQNLAE